MRFSLLALWALEGWCLVGAPIISLRLPRRGLDIPEPPPRPNWLLRAIGVVGGVIGGWAFTAAFGWPVPWLTAGPQPEPWLTAGPHPEPWMGVIFAAATTVGAFLGASLLTDIYGLIRGNRDVPRG
ncbi:MAG: hypothetical protein QOH49_487 [Acidobacteriota bacterium]|jgi:hypothetical protein|nr:hypothetical protein [Acidobacteriota bacterium]